MRVATMYAFLERAPITLGRTLMDTKRMASKKALIRYRTEIERAIPLLKVISAHCVVSLEGKYGVLVQIAVDNCGYLTVYAHKDLDLRSIDRLVKNLEDERARVDERLKELEAELSEDEESAIVDYYGYAKVQSMYMSLISESEEEA